MEEKREMEDKLWLDDEDDERMQEQETVFYVSGGKEDFVSLINASNESNGWVRKYRDYDCYRKMLGPGKLHDIAARTKIGAYVGSCICLEFDDYAFVALYYVQPEYRQKSIGTNMFKRVINEDMKKKNIGLHSAQNMSQKYDQKLGFCIYAPWLVDAIRVKDVEKEKISIHETKMTVKDAKEVGLSRIVDYDAKVARNQRENFVRHWAVERIDAVCKVVVNSTGEIVGYGCGRLLSIVGYPAFGPIYCDSDDGFKLLFHALISCFDEELKQCNQISLCAPTTKSSLLQKILQNAATFETRYQCVPQFTQTVPEHDIDKIYCITDLTMFI